MKFDTLNLGPWIGCVRSDQAIIKFGIQGNPNSWSLALSTAQDAPGRLINPVIFEPTEVSACAEISILTFHLKGEPLRPDTRFFYAPVHGSHEIIDKQGQFTTFPAEGAPASFKFACAGDASTGSNDEVFTHIFREDPLFFCHLGDLHYADTNSVQLKPYLDNYQRVFRQNRQAELYRNVPLVYIWDDHDFCGESSDGTAPGRSAALSAYRLCVPNYIDSSRPESPLFQAFTVGRVRFLVTDTRSARTPRKLTDDRNKTMLGELQKGWLLAELSEAKKRYPLVVWINSVPWLGKQKKNEDFWTGYSVERDEIGAFIESEGIRNLCMLSADMHRLAIDDGSHNHPPTGRGGFPIFQAAPLDKGWWSRLKLKGGPYSHGDKANNHQYGIVSVLDDGGDAVTVTWQGMRKQSPIRDVRTLTFRSPR